MSAAAHRPPHYSMKLNPARPLGLRSDVLIASRQLPGRISQLHTSAKRHLQLSAPLRSTASATELTRESVEKLDLTSNLPRHEKLVCGVLDNGFRYCIFPNQKPEGRFYMNLEVHAGSVDEEDHQQGLAHFLEHSVFLGTEKYPSQQDMKKLFRRLGMAFNADANAFTDFRSTVYTFSAPTTGKASHVESAANLFGAGGIATGPIHDSPAEEEISEEEELEEEEGQDNTQLVLDLLHQMTFKALIRQKDVDLERGAILSELRDRNSISQRVAMSYYKFQHGDTVLPKRFPIGLEDQVEKFSSEDLFAFYDKHYHASNMCLYVVGDVDSESVVKSIQQIFGDEPKKPRAELAVPDDRPHPDPTEPVLWPMRGAVIEHTLDKKPEKRIEIVEDFQINEFGVSFCQKEGAQGTRSVGDLRESLIDSIIGMAIEFRVHARRVSSEDPLFNGIGWSYSSSPREGCSMNSFSVSCQPKNWKEALKIGLQEAARLAEYGVTATELMEATTMLNNHYAQQAAQKDAMASSGWMKRIMSSVQAGDQVLSPELKSQVLKELSSGLTEEEVSLRAKVLFKPVTQFLHPESQTTAFVTKPANSDTEADTTAPDFSEAEMLRIIEEGLSNPLPPDSTVIPKELIPAEELRALEAKLKPSVESREADDASQVVRLSLSNGVRVAYRHNTNRPNEVRIRLQAFGGRALETAETQGLAVAASATWVNGGCGGHSPDVVSRFAAISGITYDASCGSEALTMDLVVQTSVEGALENALALAWLLVEQPDFDSKALARFKLRVDRSFRSFPKSVERKTAAAFFSMLFHPDDAWRVQELTPETVEDFDVEGVRGIIQGQLMPSNLEVAISGDFDPEELESKMTTYFGTIGGGVDTPPPWAAKNPFKVKFTGKAGTDDSIMVQDTVVRTYAMMGFPTVNRWGRLESAGDFSLDVDVKDTWPTQLPSGEEYCRKMHVSRCLSVANDIISQKLFEQIREKRGLVYGISFSWRPYRVFDGGYATVTFMPKPDQVERSIAEVKEVLADLFQNGFTDEEFDGAKGPMVTKVREADKTNGFWIHLMEDVTGRATPKDLACIQKVDEHYDAVTKQEVEEVMRECFGHSLEMLTIATGVSGPTGEEAEGVEEAK